MSTARAAIEPGGVTPVLRVRELAISLDDYTRILGFKINFVHNDLFASIACGRCNLFLSVGGQGNSGSRLRIGVEDVVALHERYGTAG